MVVIGILHKRALDYIRNNSGDLHGSVKVEWFDDDHEPIGPSLRGDLLHAGMIEEAIGPNDVECIRMTDKGREELGKHDGQLDA